jgi:hypothetical protein
VGPAQPPFNILRQNQEFTLYHAEHSSRPGPASVLLLAPPSSKPSLETLRKLEHEYSLKNDLEAACWSWDFNRIHATGYTDNVVDLMITKLIRLPALTQTALQQTACLDTSPRSRLFRSRLACRKSRYTRLSGKAYVRD